MKTKVSEKKIAANRSNARRSTGPTSDLGKSKSKLNATKQGIYATSTLLPGEDKDLYEAIKSEQRRIFKPKTFIEKALVDQLISELWTLKRIAKAERVYLIEAQKGLKEEPLAATEAEREFLEIGVAPGEQPTDSQRKTLAKLTKRATRLDEVYENLFIYDPDGRTQRLAQIKRHALQTILSIERDLERRLNRRESGKSSTDEG
jgi:hypothetical protein